MFIPHLSLSVPQRLSFCCVVSVPASVSLLRWLDDTTLLPAAPLTGRVHIIHFNIYLSFPSLLSSFIHQSSPLFSVHSSSLILCFYLSSPHHFYIFITFSPFLFSLPNTTVPYSVDFSLSVCSLSFSFLSVAYGISTETDS